MTTGDKSNLEELARQVWNSKNVGEIMRILEGLRMEEQERCAKVAEAESTDYELYHDHWVAHTTKLRIAAAIRKGTT